MIIHNSVYDSLYLYRNMILVGLLLLRNIYYYQSMYKSMHAEKRNLCNEDEFPLVWINKVILSYLFFFYKMFTVREAKRSAAYTRDITVLLKH